MSQKRSVLKEIARRQQAAAEKAKRPKFSIEEHCFDKQISFIRDPAKFKTAVCSRRAGKSIACISDLFDTASSFPDVNVLYITLNRRSAKRIVWKELLKLVNKYTRIKQGDEYKETAFVDNTELSVTLENGSTIYISGAEDEGAIDKFRGMALKKVYIDECQSFRHYIEELVNDVIVPALYDYDGELILIGTPGPIKAGYFYECTQNVAWSHHHWTIYDNPHIAQKSGKTVDQIIQQANARRGIDSNHPTHLRENLGIWAEDSNALVFQFDRLKNSFQNITVGNMTYIMGIDIGYNDSDAIAILGYNSTDKIVYLVDEFIQSKQNISQLVDKIKYYKDMYKPVRMVMDAGALGKKIQEEIQFRHSLWIEAAEKNRKVEFIELLNDDLRTGKFKARIESRFAQECFLVEWDRTNKEKPKISDRFHSDICFVAGTQIRTKNGFKNIEDIRPGELVATRNGYKPVVWSGLTGINKSVLKLKFSNGSELFCTENHPIFTKNRGFIAAKDLTKNDTFYILNEWERTRELEFTEKQSYSTIANSTPILNQKDHICNDITPDFGTERKSCYTELCGYSITETFQKDTLYTTRIKTHLTTIFQTLSVYLQNNILENISIENLLKPITKILKKLDLSPKSGTLVRKVENGILSILKNLGVKRLQLSAPSVVKNTKDQLCAQNPDLSVQMPVSQEIAEIVELTTNLEDASGVQKNSGVINTQNSDSAVYLVTSEIQTKKENVYNLKVSECPEYFANDILVHNCDSVLYAWRECKHYLSEPNIEQPRIGTDAYMDALEAKEAEEMEEKKKRTGIDDIAAEQEEMDALFEDDSIDSIIDSEGY